MRAGNVPSSEPLVAMILSIDSSRSLASSADPPRGSSPGGGVQGARGNSPRECGRKLPENARVNVPLPPPPSLASLRPERAVYRLESDSSRSRTSSRSSSPSGILGSPPRSKDGEKRRRAPPRRSPSPGPPKRLRRDDRAGRCVPPRGGRSRRGGGGGRFTGRCAPDGPDFGCGASSNDQDITRRKGLMTYKQFILILEDDVSPAEADSRYREYKTTYITTQKRAYIDLHKDETWLKETYHPTNLLSLIESSGIGEDYGNKRRKKGRGHPKESGPLSTAPKAHLVSSKYRRIQTDTEKGIVRNILSSGGDHGKEDVDRSNVGSTGPIVIVRGLSTVKGFDGVELLDTLLTYLWRIHGVDYYGMFEMKDTKGFRHVRSDNKTASAFNISDADWEKKTGFLLARKTGAWRGSSSCIDCQ